MLRLPIAALACASFLHAVDQEDHVRKSIPVSSATRLVLSADVGTIRVQPGPARSVDVDVYFRGGRRPPEYTLDVAREGPDIRVTGSFHKGWDPILSLLDIIGGLNGVEYRVTVPDKFNADVQTSGGPIYVGGLNGEVNARTSGGGITLEGGKGKAVVHTSGGPIRITEVAGDVDASTSGGGISIVRNLGKVKARTSGGGIEIREAAGAIDASTSGGGVEASLVGQPKEECRIYSSGGSISLTLSKDIRADLDASTNGGRVWTNFAVLGDDRHEGQLHTQLNGGGPRLYLHTSGGGITVRRAD